MGRSPGERNGNPLQCSCLENPMDGGAWLQFTHYGPWGRRVDRTERLHFHYCLSEISLPRAAGFKPCRANLTGKVLGYPRPSQNLPTQEKTINGHPKMVNTEIRLIISFAAEDGEALGSQQKTGLGTDSGSDHEFLIAKFRLKLKSVGKTTRPFRYDLNQIPYNCIVEVTVSRD